MIKKLFSVAFGLILSSQSLANMTLQQDISILSFISTKQDNVAEIHRFTTLSGSLQGGTAQVSLNLNSVDTNIDIRNQRMRDYLFETKQFAEATYTVNFDEKRLDSLQRGYSDYETLKGNLNFHGKSMPVTAHVQVTRLNDGSLSVTTTQPIIINAADFDLVKGINKLRTLAGLNSISYAVPVTFSVAFK